MTNVTRLKVLFTVSVLLAGAAVTLIVKDAGSQAYRSQTEGVVIDFGDFNTVWTDADYHEGSDAVGLLLSACETNGFTSTFDDGSLVEVDGIHNDGDSAWGLWYVSAGSTDFVRSADYDVDASDYTGIVWAYTAGDAEPAVIVDASGESIYGYPQATRTVTLSPSATEIIGSLDAVNTLVGVDYYSNYPSQVVAGKGDGRIATVGTYTDPNFESIMNASPDIVICDGSQYNHRTMADKLRSSETNAVLLYNGEDIDTLIDNIFIVGVAIGYELSSQRVIGDLDFAVGEILGIIGDSSSATGTMIALSSNPSPWVSGDYTYAHDILCSVNGTNAFASKSGWIHINSEYIANQNPSRIIILSEEYSATAAGYAAILSNLSAEWKSTDAFKSGEIYLFGDSLGDMTQRSGPRFAQMMELVAMILYPELFGDGDDLPKYIGDDYQEHLTITEGLGFDN